MRGLGLWLGVAWTTLLALASVVRVSQGSESLGTVDALAVSADGRLLLTGLSTQDNKWDEPIRGMRAIGRVWNLETGAQAMEFSAEKPVIIRRVAISPDGKYAAVSGEAAYRVVGMVGNFIMGPQMVSLWLVENGELLHEWMEVNAGITFSPDGNKLYFTNRANLGVVDLSDDHFEIQVLAETNCDEPVFSPDGKEAFAARSDLPKQGDRRLVAFDPTTGEEIRRYPGSEGVRRYAASSDGKHLAGIVGDSIVIWDRARAAENRRFASEGIRFEGVQFHDNDDEVLALANDGSVLSFALENGSRTKLCELQDKQEFKGFEPHALLSDRRHVVVSHRDSRVSLLSLESGAAVATFFHLPHARNWWTSVDGGAHYVKSPGWSPDTEESDEWRKRRVVPSGQEDPVAVARTISQAFAGSQHPEVGPPDGEQLPDGRPRFFYLGFGVASFKFKEYDLDYTDDDVRELSQYFRVQQRSQYSDVIVSELINEKGTRESLLAELDAVARNASPQDVVVISFSTHGIRGRRGLYLLPYEGDLEAIASCVNWSEIASRVARIRAKNVVVLLDCCHAGAFGNDRIATQDGIAVAFKGNERLLLLAASQGAQLALEPAALKHGLFTAKALDGLRGQADADQNGVVSARELCDYVTVSVHKYSKGRQTPMVYPGSTFDFETTIAVVPAQP